MGHRNSKGPDKKRSIVQIRNGNRAVYPYVLTTEDKKGKQLESSKRLGLPRLLHNSVLKYCSFDNF